jgi:predicted alpha/beta hydrolase family esterase
MANNKTAAIFHGYGDGPENFWYPYIKKELENKGYKVWLPQLPNTNDPQLEEQLKFVLENFEFAPETILIGHSAGVPLILALLEKIEVKIKQALLVAGFSVPLPNTPSQMLKEKYDWAKIKAKVEDIIFINSDNDPWGCDDKQARTMFENLGGTLIIRHGEGHMGSGKFNQPYKEFPFLAKLIKD